LLDPIEKPWVDEQSRESGADPLFEVSPLTPTLIKTHELIDRGVVCRETLEGAV